MDILWEVVFALSEDMRRLELLRIFLGGGRRWKKTFDCISVLSVVNYVKLRNSS
jgi:hypothetical protein